MRVFARQIFHFQAPLSPCYLALIPLCAPLALAPPRGQRLLLVTGAYLLFWLTRRAIRSSSGPGL